jgi:hypothetical protein
MFEVQIQFGNNTHPHVWKSRMCQRTCDHMQNYAFTVAHFQGFQKYHALYGDVSYYWCDVLSLPNLDDTLFVKAIDEGLIIRQETEDMQIVYALNVDKIVLNLRTVLTDSKPFVQHIARSERSLHVSKVGFMSMLLDQGWIHNPALASHLGSETEPQFSMSSLSKSKWFWWVMACADEIFRKLASVGLDRILLHMPGGLLLKFMVNDVGGVLQV